MVEIPTVQAKGQVWLHGDEAYRFLENQWVATYSLVGADLKTLPLIENDIRQLKRSVCPQLQPDAWVFHMRELWSGQQRKKNAAFASWSVAKVASVIHDLAAIIKKYEGKVFLYNASLSHQSGFVEPPDTLQRRMKFKNYVYLMLILNVIDDCTMAGGQPNLFFDAERRVTSDFVIQQWARESFSGTQRCLLYSFLAKNITIPEPKFVGPASQPGLEVADVLSFIIARLHFKNWSDTIPEFSPAEFGKITYVGSAPDGGLLRTRSIGFPWSQFYGDQIASVSSTI
jgi:hypothetical protein